MLTISSLNHYVFNTSDHYYKLNGVTLTTGRARHTDNWRSSPYRHNKHFALHSTTIITKASDCDLLPDYCAWAERNNATVADRPAL